METQCVSATRPGSPDRDNEDLVLACDPITILLDGAGGPAGLDTGCSHGTPWYVAVLAARLLEILVAEPAIDLAAALAEAIASVARAHPGCDLAHPGTPSSTVIITRLGVNTLDYLVLCDSTLLIETTDGRVEAICDTRIDEVAPHELQVMNAAPVGSSEHQRHRLAKVEAERAARNRPGGYWVAAADPAAAHQAITGSLPAAGLRRVALLSDGAERWAGFGLGPHTELMRLLATAGPTALLDEVRAAEHADPQGRQLPRPKVHDDATAVLITVSATP